MLIFKWLHFELQSFSIEEFGNKIITNNISVLEHSVRNSRSLESLILKKIDSINKLFGMYLFTSNKYFI